MFVDWSTDVVHHVLHIDGNGISARVLIDVLHTLSLLCFSEHISCSCSLQTLDGIGIVIVEGEVHRLVNPLLRGCFLKCNLSLEDAITLVGNDGTACSHIATNIHRDRKNSVSVTGSIDCDTSHTVLSDREWRAAFHTESAVAIVGKRNRFAIHCANQVESASIETGISLINIIFKLLEGHIFRISAKREATEYERFFWASSALVLFYPHRIDVCHTKDTLVGDEDVAILVRIDVVALEDVTQVAVIAFASYVGARGCLPASPCMLTLDVVECCAIVGMISRTINKEAITMVDVKLYDLEGTDFAIIRKDIVLSSGLYGEVSEVVCNRIIIASSIDTIGVGLLHDIESCPSSSVFTVPDADDSVCIDSIAGRRT